MKSLKQRLKDGEILHGCWLNLANTITSEIVGQAGFDWVLIDLEHGVGTESEALHQIQSLASGTAIPIFRVESSARQRVYRILDLGPQGIMFPQIRNEVDAKVAIQGMRYSPEGGRGMATMTRATQFGKNIPDYLENTTKELLGIIQVETPEILNHLDKVARVDGVDILFVGPNDLSMGLGIFKQFDHPKFKEAMKATAQAAKDAGIWSGILLQKLEDYQYYRDLGFQFLAFGSDAGFVSSGAQKTATTLKEYRDR